MFKISSTIGVMLVSSLLMNEAQAQTKMAIGEPGSESFVFGTELWALSQIALKPQFGIDLAAIEIADESERLAGLRDAEIEVALVHAKIPAAHADRIRTVMALWPDRGSAGGDSPIQVIAREDVADDVIYRITKAIFENANFFNGTRQRVGQARLERATVGVDLPLHPGAYRYYQEAGVRPDPAITGLPAKVSTTKFENFDDRALADVERAQVAAACRQALDLGALSAVLGDLSSRGCEVYQTYLEDREKVEPIQTSAKSDFFASPSPSGKGGPAIALESVLGQLQDAEILQKDFQSYKPNPRQPTM